MGTKLYVVAGILLFIWLIGFFVFAMSGLIHILLVIASIAVLLNINLGHRARI